MGRRLKKVLKFDLISRDSGDDRQNSLSSRLRSWLASSPGKYAVQKGDAMRAVVSLDEFRRQKQASFFCRDLEGCRRERCAYLDRRSIAKRHDAIVKLANAELRQEGRRTVYDTLATAAETTSKHYQLALEQAVNTNMAYMEDLGLDAEQRLGTIEADQEREVADIRSGTEEADMETAIMLAEVRDETERDDQIATMNFQQEYHQQSKQSRDEFDELKALLSAKLSDFDMVCSLLDSDPALII